MRIRTVGDLRQSARAVLGHVELDQIYVLGCELSTFERFQAPPFTTDTQLQVESTRTDDVVEVRARYATMATKQDGEEVTAIWKVDVECLAAFDITSTEEVFTEDELEAFALLVGAPAIHPYAREVTQTLSGHTLYPAFTLGLMRSMAELPEDHEVELSERDSDSAPSHD